MPATPARYHRHRTLAPISPDPRAAPPDFPPPKPADTETRVQFRNRPNARRFLWGSISRALKVNSPAHRQRIPGVLRGEWEWRKVRERGPDCQVERCRGSWKTSYCGNRAKSNAKESWGRESAACRAVVSRLRFAVLDSPGKAKGPPG